MISFWDERVWCPPGFKWEDYRPDSAQFHHIYYSVVTAAALILLRYSFETLLFRPLGRYLCQTDPVKKNYGDTATLSERRGKSSSGVVKKFGEGMWRLSFYFSASIYGWFWVLWDKPYLKDTMRSLTNYPHHPVTNDEWWYYNIELGFYISLVVTQFIDAKRKDFWQMFVHHIVTILLLVFSWACNFHRIGCLVVAIHDIGDIPLESAKLAKYCKKQRLADLIFVVFTVVWIYTRCYAFPTRVLYYTTFEALSIIPFFPAYYIFNGLLCCLQILQLFWTYVIIRMVFDALQNDGMRDLRSDTEESDEDPHTD